jgi:uncharacterized membrane protein YphA (DoxX/SURF4 family)
MKADDRLKTGAPLDWAGVIARWLVGAFFIYMGLSKALQPVEFLKLLRQYDLAQSPWLLNSVAAVLPWFEVLCGLALVAGVGVRGTALLLALLLAAFTAVVFHRGLVLRSTLAIAFCAVKFDCGCGSGEVLVCRKLGENIALLGLCAWLLAGAGRRLSLRYRLQR